MRTIRTVITPKATRKITRNVSFRTMGETEYARLLYRWHADVALT